MTSLHKLIAIAVLWIVIGGMITALWSMSLTLFTPHNTLVELTLFFGMVALTTTFLITLSRPPATA
jgi:hypothetical protein